MSPDERRPKRLAPSSRPLTAPTVVPDGGPLRDLKRLLFDLYQDCGSPSYESIARVMEGRLGALTATVIGQYLTESTLPPNQQSTMTLAAVLAGPRDPDDVRDQVRQLWVDAKNWVPPGTLISELDDPLLMEVHEAIRVAGSQNLPVLPPYLQRPHDLELLGRISAVARQGRSTMVTLVGGSSTGKTRACWEAIHAEKDGEKLLRGWRLWHPFDPTRPEAALARLDEIGPRTVVWLNEAQHYLLTGGSDLGERVAARLHRLLTDPDRAPVVVLGTLWPTYWDTLTHNPTQRDSTQPDPHAQARQLLDRTLIVVPASFDHPAVTALLEVTDTDPRLIEAATRAKDGELTQYLVGAPALLEHYETADAPAKALLTLAMDLRRLGHGPAIPEDLLQAGTPAYLTDLQWDSLDDDWFDTALRYAQQRCHGAHRPLARIRPRPGEPDLDLPHYRLADYLEQLGQQRRRYQIIPPPLWPTLVAHISNPLEASRIGRAAAKRLLYRFALPLLRQAAASRNLGAAMQLAELLSSQGDEAGLRALADTGDEFAPGRLVRLLADRGDEAGLRALADTGNKLAAMQLAELLADRGDEADTGLAQRSRAAGHVLAEPLADQGDEAGLRALIDIRNEGATIVLAGLLADRGDETLLALTHKKKSATRWTALLAALRGNLKDSHAARQLAELLADRGDEAGLWALADTGNEVAMFLLAKLLADRGDEAGLWALADTGDEFVIALLAKLLADRGDEAGLRAFVLLGYPTGIRGPIDLLTNLIARQDQTRAEALRRYGLNPDGTIAD